MTKNILLLLVSISFFACNNNAKEKAKDVINKTGETVGEGASELAKGIKNGIEKTFDYTLDLSNELKTNGLQTGKIIIRQGQDKTNNILSVYFIFTKDFHQKVSVKILDDQGNEYGRTSLDVEGKKDSASYFDFLFDKRTDIESKSKIIITEE